MTPDPKPETKQARRQRIMRTACAQIIEAADADGVAIVASFNDADRTHIRLASAGNRVLCATMLEVASERMQEIMDEDGDE